MNKTLLLDANLLVLLTVGLTDSALVGVHKKTSQFDLDSFYLLQTLIDEYQGILVTPHILAETSNLARLIGEPIMTAISKVLASLVIATVDECHVSGKDAAARSEFSRLGVTDAAILHVARGRGDVVLATTDIGLYLAASDLGVEVINFTHLRVSFGLL